jgi:hypothetical protein
LVERQGVWELPISWFIKGSDESAERRAESTRRIVKMDIDKAGADCLIAFVQRAVEARYDCITYASHSFSFIRGRGNGGDYEFDERKAMEFRRLLEFLSTADRVSTQTVSELWEDIRHGSVPTRPDREEICMEEIKAK